jgi:hypothetical protein
MVGAHRPEARGDGTMLSVTAARHDAVHLVTGLEVLAQETDRDCAPSSRRPR